ncbi:MAG: lamin tail domain-containing protein [Pseudomonadota bacterium]
MPYTLIHGNFFIHNPASPLTGPEPDGDTLKFRPDNRDLVLGLPRPNRGAEFNGSGQVNLRFEAIDALETHFAVAGETFHQQMSLALAARDALLAQMGFGEVTFFAERPFKVESVERHPVPGYILSNGLDTYGRVIAFVYAGAHPAVDGTQVFLTPEMLDASLNAFMLKHGHAWAGFYLGMPAELREPLRVLAVEARTAGRGLWAKALGIPGKPADIADMDDLQQRVIWPKLFRRLVPYFREGHTDFTALDAWLRADPRNRDDRLLLPNRELGNMHDLVDGQGERIVLTHYPEDVVIVPDDYGLLPEQPGGQPPSQPGAGSVRIVAALVDPLQSPERGHETVTLLNAGTAPVDLNGWKLADNNGRQPLSGSLPAGEAVRIQLGAAVRLSNTRDTLSLLDGTDALIDQVSYEKRHLPPPGHSLVF